MGTEDLKDSLRNNFSLMEYFDKSFSFFSKFLRENKGLVIAYILISIISNLSARFINLDGIKTETLFLCVLLEFLIFYLPITLLIKKIQNRMVVDIEGSNAEVSYKELFLKIIKCVLAIFVLIVVAAVIVTIVARISIQLAIILYVGGVVFIALHLLYFNSLYYIRDVKIFDAVTYNVHLCKGCNSMYFCNISKYTFQYFKNNFRKFFNIQLCSYICKFYFKFVDIDFLYNVSNINFLECGIYGFRKNRL